MAKATKTAEAAAKATKTADGGDAAFIYPEYDLWKVDVESIAQDKDSNPKQVKLTAVKIIRPAVKLEDNAAELLNKQSHNNLRRYYLKGSIQNGHEETITIK